MRLAVFLLICSIVRASAPVTWNSATTGEPISGRVVMPADSTGPLPTVVYLTNLSIPRLGQEQDQTILADLTDTGHLVLVLDYAHHPKAVSPDLAADLLKLRQDIAGKNPTLLREYKVDATHLFILPEGFRLKRDVEFARDGQRVLGLDIIYPSKPARSVPVLMEITCDNKDRMGSFSLLFCHDTLVEGAALAGFAAAMVDHPVTPPYKGLDDPMPQCVDRMKSAVKVLRGLSDELHLNGKIGAIGFSRGGPFAAILAAQGDVQAALIHGNRYDYLDLRADDPLLPRFEKAWGPRDSNQNKWAEHGASYYVNKNSSPMFLNTSNTESPEYRDGLETFAGQLRQQGIENVYTVDLDSRGHQVSTEPKTLDAIYRFFSKHLNSAGPTSRATESAPPAR
jgi:dienelactone hydrolase